MAQIANGSSINLLDLSTEELQAFTARMAFPPSYLKGAKALCGLTDEKGADVPLSEKVKFSIPRREVDTGDLKIGAASKGISKSFVTVVFQLIKNTQAHIITPRIDGDDKKLRIEEECLSRVTLLIAKAYKLGMNTSFTHLSTRNQMAHTHKEFGESNPKLDLRY
jgi:hypothetical protein